MRIGVWTEERIWKSRNFAWGLALCQFQESTRKHGKQHWKTMHTSLFFFFPCCMILLKNRAGLVCSFWTNNTLKLNDKQPATCWPQLVTAWQKYRSTGRYLKNTKEFAPGGYRSPKNASTLLDLADRACHGVQHSYLSALKIIGNCLH